MKQSLGAKTQIYPMPVFIIGTYNDDGTPNAMNAAWGGIANENRIAICVDRSHKTAENVIKRKAFTIGIADADHIEGCDYVGMYPETTSRTKWPRPDSTPRKRTMSMHPSSMS